MTHSFSRIPEPKTSLFNPSDLDLRAMVSDMPNAGLTEFGNYNVTTKVVSRSKSSTFIVSDRPHEHSGSCIPTMEGEKVAEMQNAFVRNQDMIIIDGYIGNNPTTKTATRLMVEKKHANIAAMQKQLYFPISASEKRGFVPVLHIIYTPSLMATGYPNDRLIAVDLQSQVTRIFNSDYFGESKKAGLRMWNKLMFDQGGLAMHAGCKKIPVAQDEKVMLIIGLSGTGKTTTTFTSQNDSTPIQDDFVALMQDGSCLISENGCFAKTFGLDKNSEPAIYHAVIQPNAYLENVSMDASGKIDFFDYAHTQNGRATFPFASISQSRPLSDVEKVDCVFILNKNQDIIPAVAKLTPTQAAAYFMLGETMGTSAGGVEEAGQALRIPGTNPFFPLLHNQQGLRFLELITKHNIQVYLMNTGRIGGSESVQNSMKVKIKHSSAIVKAIVEDRISWKTDCDFGYQIAKNVPGMEGDDNMLLESRRLYEYLGHLDDYNRVVAQLKKDRLEYLKGYPEIYAVVHQGG